MRLSRYFPYLAGIFSAFFLLHDVPADEFPIAPLPRVQTEAWGKVFRLANRRIEVIIAPEHDGIVSLSPYRGENVLSAPIRLLPANRETLDKALPRLEGVRQPRWQSRGWMNSEGGQTVLLTQSFGEPVHLRISHLITLPENSTELQWTARMTAISPIDPLLPAFFEFPSATLLWESTWKIESGEELPIQRETTETSLRETLASTADLTGLPPQGWTLLVEGILRWTDPERPDE